MPLFQKSPMSRIEVRGRRIYVKRDDLLQFDLQVDSAYAGNSVFGGNSLLNGSSLFNGNKARKLYKYLIQDHSEIKRLVSFGSVQSNMLCSLAALAQLKGWQLQFYVHHLPEHLFNEPRGNYGFALQMGAQVIATGKSGDDMARELQARMATHADTLYIPEGGFHVDSELGIKCLADEVIDWVRNLYLNGQGRTPIFMLPSGTGVMAMYLQKHLPFEVLTCACAGDEHSLRQSFEQLPEGGDRYPRILPLPDYVNDPQPLFKPQPRSKPGYGFGQVNLRFYDIWRELRDSGGIEFDLLYDPLGWICLLDYLQSDGGEKLMDQDIIYLHQGGLLGNLTMLERYRRAGIADA